MNKIKSLLTACLLFTAAVINAQNKPGVNFNTYLEFVKEIMINDKEILGDISFIDTYGDKIILCDKYGNNVYLINNKGKILKKLNPDESHPGIIWRPYIAYFTKKGEILVGNGNAPWGFFFDKEGKGIGIPHHTFSGVFWYAFTNNDQIIAYNANSYGLYLCLSDNRGKEIKKFGVFPERFNNLIQHRMGGGVVTDKDDNIYQLNVSGYEITKYDKNGKYIKTLKCKPDRYIPPQRDYRKTDNVLAMQQDMLRMEHFTNAIRLYLLDKDILAVEYFDGKVLELTLCDLEGNRLNNKPITYEKYGSLFAKDGFLYFTCQGKKDSKGNIANPSIMMYKFKTNMKGK